MKRLPKPIAATAAAACLALGVAACGTAADSSGEAKFDLVVGNLVPQTGELDEFGRSGEKAAALAVIEINAAIKDAGSDHTIKLATEDEGSDAASAEDAAAALADKKAACITGGWASAATLAAAEQVAIPGEVPMVSPASTSDEISGLDDDDLVSRTAPPDRYQGAVLADAIAKDVGGAKGATVNIGARDDAYGTGLAEDFTTAWEAQGGEVGTSVTYAPGKATGAEATDLTSGTPDAVLVADYPESFAKLLAALAGSRDWDPSTAWGTDGLATDETAGLVGLSDALEGMRVTAPSSPSDDDAAKAFDKLYEGGDPKDVKAQPFAAQAFDAVILCYLGAVAAEGVDDGVEIGQVIPDLTGPDGDEFTYEELADAIEALEDGDDIDYQGVSGDLDMDKGGDPTTATYDVFDISKGKLTPGEQLTAEGADQPTQ